MSAEVLLAGMAIAFMAAACYAVTGFGFALVMTPLLAVAWDVKSAVVTSVVLSTLALLPLLAEVRAHVPVARASVLVLGSFAGIPLGVLILQQLESDALQALVAATVIVAALLLYFRPMGEAGPDTRAGQLAAGFVSGVVGGSTSMGGPPIVLYLLGREHEVAPFRATLFSPSFCRAACCRSRSSPVWGGSRAMCCCWSWRRCRPSARVWLRELGYGATYARSGFEP